MAIKNYYEILGVEITATPHEIKKAFHTLAHKYHPDAASSQYTKEKFFSLVEAYDTLSDPELRADYDVRTGIMAKIKSTNQQVIHHDHNAELFTRLRTKVSADDGALGNTMQRLRETERAEISQKIPKPNALKKKLVGFLQRLFSNDNSRKAASGSTVGNNQPVRQFTIDAVEALVGCSRELAIDSGDNRRKLKVVIPPNTKSGTILRLAVSAQEKIEIEVNIVDHRFLAIRGNDLELTVVLTIGEALRGLALDFPFIGGNLALTIPPLVALSKERIRIPAKGLSDGRGGYGDLYVRPRIDLPPDQNSSLFEDAAQAIDRLYTSEVRTDFQREMNRSFLNR